MITLVEAACGAALSNRNEIKQMILFCGETADQVTRNLHAAVQYMAASTNERGLDAKLSILKILHHSARKPDGCGAPYYFQILRKPSEESVKINLKFSSDFQYSDDLMLPAALMYGSNKDMANAMRLSDLNSLEIPIKMIHSPSVYKDFLAEVNKAFAELGLDNFLPLIWSVTAAILHIKSGNLQIAEDLLGAQSDSLIDLGNEPMDRDTYSNALFHCTAKIISDVLFSKTSVDEGDQIFNLFGVVKKYSTGLSWTDFCLNYQKDILHLQETPNKAVVCVANANKGGSNEIHSMANDPLEVLECASKGKKLLKVYHLFDIITYRGNWNTSYGDYFAALLQAKLVIKSKKWEQINTLLKNELGDSAEHTIQDWESVLKKMNDRMAEFQSYKTLEVHCSEENLAERRENVFCATNSDCTLCNLVTSKLELSAQMKVMHGWSNSDNSDDVDLKTMAKVKIKELIAENRLTLDHIQAIVAKDFNIELSLLDMNFICKKYIKYCLRFWLEDTLTLCENLKLDQSQQYLDGLDNFRTLKVTEDIPEIFAFSKFLKLVCSISKLITQRSDEEHVLQFKKEMRHSLMKLNEGVEKELQFIQAFVAYIRSFKKLQILANELKLKEFCSGSLSFEELRNLLLTPGILKGELGYTTLLRVKSISDEVQFTQLKKLQKFLKLYIQSPELNVRLINENCYLEAKSMVMELDEIKATVMQHIKLNPNLNEVRIIVGDTLYLDNNMESDAFHGKNIVVYCRRLIVFNDKVRIDVSGKDCDTTFENNAGQADDGSGKNGEDGTAGESGGNIAIIAEEIINAKNLCLVSNGGKGGSGQNGGDGKDGDNGIGMTKDVLHKTYDSPVRFWRLGCSKIASFIERLKDTSTSTIDKPNMNTSYFYEGKMSDGKEITYNHDHWIIGSISGVFLCKGTYGQTGKPGGVNGLAGDGGFGGDIDISNDFVMKISNDGEEGAPGSSGLNGNPGSNAWDIGYQDYCNWTSPVYLGENQRCKLTIEEYSARTINRTWCNYKQCYIQLEQKSTLSQDISSLKEQQKECQRTKKASKAEAVNQKMVSKDDVLSNYREYMDSSRQSVDSVNFSTELGNLQATRKSLQTTSEESTEQEKLNIQVQRESNFEEEKKVSIVVFDQKPSKKVHVKLLDSRGIIKKEVIQNIKNVYVDKDEINDLAKMMSTSQFWKKQTLTTQEQLILKQTVVSNYRKSVLVKLDEDISKRFKIDTKIPYLLKDRYMQLKSEKSKISDVNLHDIDQYILEDTMKIRSKVVNLCKTSLLAEKKSKNIASAALEIFLNDSQAGNLDVKYADKFESHSNALKCFKIEKELNIESCRCEFIALIEPHEKLCKYWKAYEKNEIDRKKFETKLENFVKGFNTAATGRIAIPDAYNKIHENIDSTYEWKLCLEDNELMELFYLNILQRGLRFNGYIQLLAEIFSVRIDLYGLNEKGHIRWYDAFNLKESDTDRILSILKNEQENYSFLKLNENFTELENIRYTKGNLYNKIIWKLVNENKKSVIDSTAEEITSNPLEIVEKKCSLHCSCEENDMEFIADIVKWEDTKSSLKKRLQSISRRCIPNTIILHLLAQRFSYESCCITYQEMIFLINRCLQSHINKTQEISIVQWIIATKPQEHWIAELTLLHIQNFYKTSLGTAKILLKNILNVKKRDLLLLFNIQLENTPEEASLPANKILQFFALLSEVRIIPNELYENDLGNWLHIIESAFWHGRLYDFFLGDTNDNLNTATYYVQTLENTFGKTLVTNLLQAFQSTKELTTSTDILQTLKLFVSGEWNLTDKAINNLSAAKTQADFLHWKQKVAHTFSDDSIRSMVELLKIIKKSDKQLSSSTYMENVEKIATFKNDSDNKDGLGTFIVEVQSCNKLSDLKNKIPDLKEKSLENIAKLLIVIDQCVFLHRKFRLRDTQKLSVLLLLGNSKSNLLQVSTGEGKTLIVVASAIIKALQGEKVDIITSSSILAKRDALANKDVYDFFNVSVYHNGDEKVQERIKAYSTNRVIYGDMSAFQRDYLLDRFYGKNILGDRKFENIIVDEVDSMLLDKGNNMLYLSHDLPWLDKLTPLYIFIWQWINQPGKDFEYIFDDANLQDIILHDLFGVINKNDLTDLDPQLSNDEVSCIWQKLVDQNILNDDGTLKKNYNNISLDDILGSNYEKLKIRLRFKFLEVENRQKTLCLPEYLMDFVKRHLNSWIKSAHNAFFMKERENYIVDVNRTQNNVEMSPNIIIIDRDTGMDQANSQWDEALHQFLQLKHGCKLSAQSLKAVFVSNVSYFKLYSKLYGLTGTLGSKREREMLKEIHEVDFITMPTAKSKRFTEESPILCCDDIAWMSEIKSEIRRIIGDREKPRSILMICETVDQVESFKRSLQNENIKIQTYTRDYEDFEFSDENPLDSGILLMSTNLAGRGTDIKISDKLLQNGGLHIILTFLPGNCRIEQQAFGRAARCGQPGTGRLIFLKKEAQCISVVLLKRDRDNCELKRLSSINKHYQMSILLQENCFQLFKNFYLSFKKGFKLSWKSALKRAKSGLKQTLFDVLNQKVESNCEQELKAIVLQSFLDEWAYWLDSKSTEISNAKTTSDCESVLNSARNFIGALQSRKTPQTMLKNNPSALIRLGKHYSAIDKHYEAIKAYDQVIESEPNFSEAAIYYKAFALGKKNQWTSNAELLTLLEKAKRLFEKHSETCYKQSAIVNTLKSTNSSKLVQIEAFKAQQQTTKKVYDTFIDSIDSVLGFNIDASQFETEKINSFASEKLLSKMKSEGVISWPRVELTSENEIIIKEIAKSFGVDFEDLKNILKQHADRFEETSFKKSFKGLEYPCRENFWKLLIQKSVLRDEFAFVEINKVEIKKFANDKQVTTLEAKSKYPESFAKSESKTFFKPRDAEKFYFVSMDDVKNVFNDNELVKHLISKQIMRKNKFAVLDRSVIKNTTLSKYATITIETIKNLSIDESDAALILKELERKGILREHNDIYSPASEETDFNNISLETFPIYTHAVRSMLQFHLCYHIALSRMVKETDVFDLDRVLPSNNHTAIIVDLADHNIVTQSKVTFDGCLKCTKPASSIEPDSSTVTVLLNHCGNAKKEVFDALGEELKPSSFYWFLPDELKNEEAARHASEKLLQLRTMLKNLNSPKGYLQNVSEKFTTPSLDTSIILNSFDINGLDSLFTFDEEKWTRTMIFNTIIVVALGLCQLMAGIAVEVFSAGALTWAGAGLINEGVNDLLYATTSLISGHFSWAEYRKQKLISLAMTVFTFSIAAYFSRGAKVSRYGSKLFKSADPASQYVGKALIKEGGYKLLKECGKTLVTKSVQGIAFGLVSIGVDNLANNYLKKYCDSLAEKVLTSMHEAIENHNLNILLEKAYKVFGPTEGLRILENLNNEFFSETNAESKFYFLKTIAESFNRAVSEVSSKTGSTSTGQFAFQSFMSATKIVGQSFNFYQVCNITNDLLNEMELKLREEIKKVSESTDKESATSSSKSNYASFETFKYEVTKLMKASVNNHVGNYINQVVVCPILKSCGNFAVRCVGQGIQNCYKWCKGSDVERQHKVTYVANQKDLENETTVELSEEIRTALDDQNEKLQLKAMEQTRNPDEIAKHVAEGSQMEMTCVKASLDKLEESGQKYCLKVTDPTGTYTVESNQPPDKGVVTIEINLKDGHFYNPQGERVDLGETGKNDCLFRALSPYLSKDVSSDDFRKDVVSRIQRDQNLRSFIRTGEHGEYLAKGFHGGRQALRDVEDDYLNNNSVQKITEEGYDFYSCNHTADGSNCSVCPQMGKEAIKIPLGSNFTCETPRVIYEYDCKFCDNCYIGRTEKQFAERAGSHQGDVRNERAKALAQHIKSHLEEKIDNTPNVKNINDWFQMKILESVPEGENIAAREQARLLEKNPRQLINKIDAVKQKTPLRQRKNL